MYGRRWKSGSSRDNCNCCVCSRRDVLSSVLCDVKLLLLYGRSGPVLSLRPDFSQGCSIEAERFNQALPEFGKRNAEVVGVSMDPLEKHEEFCTAKGLTFKLLSDGDGSVSASYGADLKIPILGKFSDRQTFLIDGKGTVVGHWLGATVAWPTSDSRAHRADHRRLDKL